MNSGESRCWLLWLLLATTCTMTLGVQQLTNPRIVEHPESQYVARNEPATLNCMAEGEPPPVITWYRDGALVETSLRSPSSHRMLLPRGQLFFLRIIHSRNSRLDVGTYYCNATNPETRVSAISRNATLEIAVLRDEFRESPHSVEVALTDLATLTCRPPRGLPEPHVHWLHDGRLVTGDGRVRVTPAGSLLVHDARKHDAGAYVCVASNVAGEKMSNPARLYVREKPVLLREPADSQTEEGETVQFTCLASGDPPPTILWKKERGQISPGRSRILHDRSLRIVNVQISDEGVYSCRAANSVGSVEARAKLTVHSHPSFIITPKDKVVGLGRRVTFRCGATGNPTPDVYWNRDSSNKLMFPRQDYGRFSVTGAGTLVIEPVHDEDAGEYICQAHSVAGNAYCKATLTVKEIDPRPPPIIHQGPQNQTLPVDSHAMLRCTSSGNPPPIISWYKNNELIRMFDPRIALLDTGTLQISDLKLTDTAMYTCKAFSETGQSAWTASLIVEEQTNPNVIFHRTPEPSTFPGSPSRPHISDITDTSMRLAWKASTNHGASPISSYAVEYFSHETGDGWIVATDSVTEQRYTVRHLRPDTSYMFLIRAKNTHGLSLPSEVSDPVRTSGGSGVKPPLVVYDLHMVAGKLSGNVINLGSPIALSSTAIKINWDVRKAQRYIEGFHVKYRVMPDAQRRPASGAGPRRRHDDYAVETVSGSRAATYVLRRLRKYTWYEVRVQPFYRSVEGQLSGVVRVRTLEDVPSAAPRQVDAKLQRNNSLLLSWSPPPFDDLNGPLRGYRVYLYGNESRYSREVKTNVSARSIVLPSLTEGVVYRVQVAGWNRMGVGVKSEAIIIGGDNGQGMMNGFVGETWFIITLICTIGGTLWVALCVFSVWLYRKRRTRTKLKKGGAMSVAVRTNDSVRLGSYLNTPNYMQKDIANHVEAMRPDVANVRGGGLGVCVGGGSKDAPLGAGLYKPPEPGRALYKGELDDVEPYATTTLIANPVRQPGGATGGGVFRPIPSGYDQGRSANTEAVPLLAETPGAAEGCEAFHPANNPNAEYGGGGGGPAERQPMLQRQLVSPATAPLPPQPVLFLPPPPEHPPPSDIGTPPDSPTFAPAAPYGRYHTHSPVREALGYAARGPASHTDSAQQRAAPRTRANAAYAPQRAAYAPRAASEPDRGPTPPVRAYKLVPVADRHYSDTDGAPQPPRRMLASPPSPAPRDANDGRPDSDGEAMPMDYDDGVYSPHDELPDPSELLDYYNDDSQRPSPTSGDPHGGRHESWGARASDSSPHSSDESDASFLADTDFAVAVAKAAELSGLTVIGSTVVDPNAGKEREKVRRTHKQRERARRPSSPYSTDSNYSCIDTPRPYPKSERRKQMQEPVSARRTVAEPAPPAAPVAAAPAPVAAAARVQRPAVKTKPHVPQHVADLPSYNKPSFPSGNSSGSGAAKSRGGGASHASADSDASVRLNPLAAFDTRHTPIV